MTRNLYPDIFPEDMPSVVIVSFSTYPNDMDSFGFLVTIQE